jgi:predicted sulfurtransferase
MKKNKIILFYKYVHLKNPHEIVKWQKELCTLLQLKGRIIIAHEGINGTLGGSLDSIDQYISAMNCHDYLNNIDFKENNQVEDHFPRLRIIVKDEIVKMGIDPAIIKAEDGGIHLEPEAAHALIQNKPEDLLILDARNEFEYEIGRFENAVKSEIAHFRDFPSYIDSRLEQFKDKQVLMYCTGGIRCERASAYLKSKNVAKNVYQLKGGIHRYIEKFPDGYFKGKNYVFDGRISVKVTPDILSNCYICKVPCDEYNNCLRASCNRHFICCPSCLKMYENTCGQLCLNLLNTGDAQARPMPQKEYTNHDSFNSAS